MPIYEYECECGTVIEALQNIKDDKLILCNCGNIGILTRIVSKSYFRLKGTCWAKDGYTKAQAILKDKRTSDEIKKSV